MPDTVATAAAVIADAEHAVNAAATAPKRTTVTLANPDPVMVTFVPSAP